jgi:hypothetical protein
VLCAGPVLAAISVVSADYRIAMSAIVITVPSFEHVVSKVEAAAGQLGVQHPIAIDNNDRHQGCPPVHAPSRTGYSSDHCDESDAEADPGFLTRSRRCAIVISPGERT